MESDLLGFSFWLVCLLAVGPWAGHWTSMSTAVKWYFLLHRVVEIRLSRHKTEVQTYRMCPHAAPSISVCSLLGSGCNRRTYQKATGRPRSGFSFEFTLLTQIHIMRSIFLPYPLLTSDWIIYDIARYLCLEIILFCIVIVDPRGQFAIQRHLTHRGNLASWGHLTSWGHLKPISTVVPRKRFPFPRVGVIALWSSNTVSCGRKNKERKGKADFLAHQSSVCRRSVCLLIAKQWLRGRYSDPLAYRGYLAVRRRADAAVPTTELLSSFSSP